MKWEKQQLKTLEFNGVEYIKLSDVLCILTNITDCTPEELQTIHEIAGAFAMIQANPPITTTRVNL